MAFHIGNLGAYGRAVGQFADLDGYVPVAGESLAHMRYPPNYEMDDTEWESFVADAVRATAQAGAEIAAWVSPEEHE